MIVTELYSGQGLGNQLWSYVVTRALALDRDYQFGIMGKEKFKGKEFLNLDFGLDVIGGEGPEGGPPISLPNGIENYYVEKDIWHPRFKCDIRGYDENLRSIKDNTKIEGYFQSENFIKRYRKEVCEWLKVKAEWDCYDFSDDKICILNIRGGEYRGNKELILDRSYWINAMENMRKHKADLTFVAITDDVPYVKKLLPEIQAFHFEIGKDYSIVKNAHYLVIANSSFSFFPAWTSQTLKHVIAPKYWARHNVSDGFWACEFNIYSNWAWQDRDGKIFTAEECTNELLQYKKRHNVAHFSSRPIEKEKNKLQHYLFQLILKASKFKRKYIGRRDV